MALLGLLFLSAKRAFHLHISCRTEFLTGGFIHQLKIFSEVEFYSCEINTGCGPLYGYRQSLYCMDRWHSWL
ncbi:hypothetical protein ScPMuIL_006044 [Solemya velum]